MTKEAQTIKDLAATVLAQDTEPITEARIKAVVVPFMAIYPNALAEQTQIIRYLLSDFSVVSDVYQILEDETDKHVRWITEMRAEGALKWKFWHRYELYQKPKMAAPTLNQLDNLTNDILDRLPYPKTPGPWDRRGMVVGQVQSGKTGNYIGLINKAADAGYKFIIVLAGLHDSLRTQTQIRVDAGFLGFNTQATMNFAKANNQIGVGKFNKSLAANALTTSNYDGDFSKSSARKSGLNIKGTDPVILVIKKNTSILRNLIQWVAGQGETKPDGRKLVENVPMLLIDDEADNASINVSKDKISTTNGLIRSLLALFEQSAYVGYTATPFANIFVPILDEEMVKGLNIKIKDFKFNVGQDLFPRDFIINIPAPSNYIGPTRMFGLPAASDSESGEEPLPLLISLSNPERFADDYKPFVPDKHKKNDPLPDYLPLSLLYAVKSFMLVCAARRARGQSNQHNSMLIHVSRFVFWQDRISSLMDDALKAFQKQIEFNQGTLWAELEEIWNTDFRPVTNEVMESALANPSAFKDPGIVTLTWEEVAEHLFAATAKIEVRAVHGDKKIANLTYHNISPLDYFQAEQETPARYMSIIAVGGDKLSRGLTLEGLSISYYLRASKMYDTLMQMGRWFGYRPGYADLCRLFTSAELISWYEHITIASEEVRAEFDRMFLLGRSPRDFGLKVRTHSGLLTITALNKFRYHRIERLSYSAELKQTHRFKVNGGIFRNNHKALERLLSLLGKPIATPVNRHSGKNNLVWKTDSSSIKQFLTDFRIGSEVIDTAKMVDYIDKQLPKGSLTDWTVALISSSTANHKWTFTIDGQPTEIGLTRRKNSANDWQQTYAVAKAQVISPQDEFIDLTDDQIEKALLETQQDWIKKKKEGTPSYPSTFRIKDNRTAKKGLLLIYPLDPEVEYSEGSRGNQVKKKQTLANVPVVGFAISFPNIENDEKVEYAVNEQFISEYDYDESLDNEDDE